MYCVSARWSSRDGSALLVRLMISVSLSPTLTPPLSIMGVAAAGQQDGRHQILHLGAQIVYLTVDGRLLCLLSVEGSPALFPILTLSHTYESRHIPQGPGADVLRMACHIAPNLADIVATSVLPRHYARPFRLPRFRDASAASTAAPLADYPRLPASRRAGC